MNRYRVTIARLETRVYHFEIEAASEEDARCNAWEAWEADDPGEGECVHAEEWLQDSNLIKEQKA